MDRNVSWHCVYQTLQLLVKSGLAHEIIPDDETGRRYTHELAIAQCNHAHLVWKDCGMMVAGESEKPTARITLTLEAEQSEP